jgi:hypothetical protein
MSIPHGVWDLLFNFGDGMQILVLEGDEGDVRKRRCLPIFLRKKR